MTPSHKPQKTYGDNGKVFTKTIIPRELYDGPSGCAWARERLFNEAAILKLISEQTTIPVPGVVDVGKTEDGTIYLHTTLICNALPISDVYMECKAKHSFFWSQDCERQSSAKASADRFIREVVLPNLDAIPRSFQSGFNGTVIPPPHVTNFDARDKWLVQHSSQPAFRFMHGDLGPGNILVDKDTLEVVGLIDWENGGYIPEGCLVLWAASRADYYALFGNVAVLEEYVKAISG